MTEIRGERTVLIDAPPEAVFEYVSDIERHHEWNHQIIEIIRETDGPTGVGTQFRAREQPPKKLPLPMKLMFPLMKKMVGMGDYTNAEITEWEPNRKIGWKAWAPLRDGELWMRTQWHIELEPENGATRVTQRFEYVPEHERAKKGMSPDKATTMVGEEVADNLGNLKQVLESRVVQSHAGATSRPAGEG